ncbi:amidohydrolase family protein [Brachybacterium sp. ACRRE]|uniref:amidohydrolase family protein n=1 Tax=Brachybacterium sp. ACRRE TaxID=2918184 RepID=UPI001EF3B595|nr:amidohydrolase family protein [Brachybacterium sp. ACRRE]MCG7308966.1 amidohydrolase family protein [Brachybacterium sp. ACRRE]
MTPASYVPAPTAAGSLVLADVAVVDPASGEVTAHQDVRLEGERIASVAAHDDRTEGRSEDAGAAASPRVVDASGLFVVPAYVDAHAHPLNDPEDVDATYALMLAAGVAGYRQMSGSDELLARRAAGTLRSPEGSPRLLALPGDLLTPITAPDAKGAASTVRHQAERGADFIKAGFTNRSTLLAAIAEGKEVGLDVVGHVPDDIDAREASEAGMHCMEHLGTGVSLYAASSRREQQVRKNAGGVPSLPRIPGLAPIANRIFQPFLMKLVVNPVARTSEKTAENYRLVDRTFDEQRAESLARLLAANTTWQCPTLIRVHTQQIPGTPRHRDDPRKRFIAPDVLAVWESVTDTFEELPAPTREALAEHWEAQLRMTRVLADADVPMLTGTDSNGASWVIPGLGLHDEFALLSEAGVSPTSILRAATSDAARFFGREDRAGAVRAGFEADLVLLGGDPTADAAALADVRGVVRDGAYRDRAALDEMLERLAARPTAR